MTETYKIVSSISSPIMDNFFILEENTHNLRNSQGLSNRSRIKTVRYKLWANLRNE